LSILISTPHSHGKATKRTDLISSIIVKIKIYSFYFIAFNEDTWKLYVKNVLAKKDECQKMNEDPEKMKVFNNT
jgi:hypothetical protein